MIPVFASAQADFETRFLKINSVSLPQLEDLTASFAPTTTRFNKKLPSFKMNRQNYREPVSMFEAISSTQQLAPSNINVSLDPREYGIFGGNTSYTADGSTAVKNIAYKESRSLLRPELLTNSYGFYPRPKRSGFYIDYGIYTSPSQ